MCDLLPHQDAMRMMSLVAPLHYPITSHTQFGLVFVAEKFSNLFERGRKNIENCPTSRCGKRSKHDQEPIVEVHNGFLNEQ